MASRPWPFLFVGVLLAFGSLFALAGTPVQPAEEALLDRDSNAWKATERAERDFGSDPVAVVAVGDLDRTLDPSGLDRLSVLETCLAGAIERGRGELFELCRELSELDPAAVFTGPATFLGRAVAGIGGVYREQLRRLRELPTDPRRAAERRALLAQLAEVVARYGLISPPSLRDPAFVNRVVFGARTEEQGPKPRLSYLFPSRDTAQVVIRLDDRLDQAERSRAIELIRGIARHPDTQIEGVRYLVTGSPVVFEGLDGPLRVGIAVVIGVALVLMGLALMISFGSAWRLLPLLLAALAVTVASGVLAVAGGRLSLAALAAAPILVGLSVDYAVQLQARFDEAPPGDSVAAARTAAGAGVPVLATASLATAAGFLAMAVSGYPLVAELGLLLGIGLPLCLLVVFLFGFPLLGLRGPGAQTGPLILRFGWFREVGRMARAVFGSVMLVPGRALVIALLVAACGWVVGTRAETATAVAELLPGRSDQVADFREAERRTGTSGEVDLVVRAPDVTDPPVVRWLDGVRTDVLTRAGYLTGRDGRTEDCDGAVLCPGPSISDFVPTGSGRLDADDVKAGLAELPPEELRSIVPGSLDADAGPQVTRLPFAVRSPSVEGQSEAIDLVRDAVDGNSPAGPPPAGVTAEVAGVPAVVTESLDRLSSERYLLVLLAIAAVAVVLAATIRPLTRAAAILVPVVAVVGWSSLLLATAGIALNPLSAVLSVMVVAIATEFGVLLASRFREESEGSGQSDVRALRSSYGRTGAAVGASAVAAVAGFAALGASDIPVVREFGLVALIDLAVAVAGVMLILPATLLLAKRWESR